MIFDEGRMNPCIGVWSTYQGEHYNEKSNQIAVGIDDLQGLGGATGALIIIGDEKYWGIVLIDEGCNPNVTLDYPYITIFDASNLQVKKILTKVSRIGLKMQQLLW